LVVTDGLKDLHAALDMLYPLTPRQACWVHKLRNASRSYTAKSKAKAMNKFKEWRRGWIGRCPKAVECVEKDIDNLLNFYDCPKKHWKE
jgi:transposase-like protein